ncbi:MAG TPA: AGE family epimerase/isomerase [Planctomycetota bacterium]|nr:AGE family epimerase/isomerase [Planctomycetota bacterium]
MQPFRRTIVAAPTLDAFRKALPDYEVMLVTILDAMLDRYERDPDYPFIDTKLSILTGDDFPEPADVSADFRGKTAVYAWIQGRGLESLVGHARWLERATVLSRREKDDRLVRVGRMIGEVFRQMELVRAKNDGRLSFMMTPEGEPFDLDERGRRRPVRIGNRPCNFSDLFYAKGMLAAGDFLALDDRIDDAKRSFRRVLDDVFAERFESDQVQLNPSNPRPVTAGQFAQGPRMIAVGGCALFAELTDDDAWFESGERLVRELMEKHLNLGQFPELERGDYFEVRDARGRPWKENGRIRSDPGHSLEFVGLSAKFLLDLRSRTSKTASQQHLLEECATVFPEVFLRNFANGYHPKVGGIIKNFDLVSRTPISWEMPWWCLPETMRAAALVLKLAPGCRETDAIVNALVDCSNGFMTCFVNPDVHLLAYQTVGPDGKPVDAIPATPDADPGYHTGLSLIDMLDVLAEA